jgi:hypothetical protein
MKISYDSQSTIFLSNNPAYHSKTKHIDVQCHFMRDMVERNKVLLEKVDTLGNIEDSLTKYVSVVKFSRCIEAMGIDALVLCMKVKESPGFNKEDNKWENVGLLYYL